MDTRFSLCFSPYYTDHITHPQIIGTEKYKNKKTKIKCIGSNVYFSLLKLLWCLYVECKRETNQQTDSNFSWVTLTTVNTWHDSLIAREVMNGHKLVVLQTYRHQHRVLIEFRLPVWLSNRGICFQIWNHFMFSKYCNIGSQLGKYVSAMCTNDEAFNFCFKQLSFTCPCVIGWAKFFLDPNIQLEMND